jgi:hypothetical protein
MNMTTIIAAPVQSNKLLLANLQSPPDIDLNAPVLTGKRTAMVYLNEVNSKIANGGDLNLPDKTGPYQAYVMSEMICSEGQERVMYDWGE